MQNKIYISATIVLHNENKKELTQAVNSFLSSKFIKKKLFLIDNSPTKLKSYDVLNHPDITYIFNDQNLGFAKANNSVIGKIKGLSKYHLILNPDTQFNSGVLKTLTSELDKNNNIAMIAPKVQFPDGKAQFTARKYPSMFDLFARKTGVFKNKIFDQEYRNQDLSQPFYPEAIHGCFMLFKTEDFVKIGGFDERYFLYMEDIDICKKIDVLGKKKLYFPEVKITHVLKKGSSKNIILLFHHLSSAFKYFLKWRKKHD